MSVTMIFLTLLFAHLLADYPLQGEFLALQKGKNPIALVSHAGIWTGVITVASLLIGIPLNIFDISFLFIVHTLADYAKAKPLGFYEKLNPLGMGLLIDQLIHVLQIVLLIFAKVI